MKNRTLPLAFDRSADDAGRIVSESPLVEAMPFF
jgi:hypothetical protein